MPTLDWIGKKAVLNHHNEVPFHLLKEEAELSVGDPGNGNLLVEGDNLLALKALLPYYAGRVKCIYIDPPYNTGKEGWIYNDNVNSPEIRKWLGKVVGGEMEDLSRHDKWLCMMYPRLRLLRDFLREDGVIIVSIDDFEAFNLRYLLNEIFGPNNFIAQLVWDKTRKNDAKLFSVGHEYLIVYGKSLARLRQLKTVWRESKPGADEIMAKFYDLRSKHGKDYQAMEAELATWYKKDLPKGHPSKKLSRYRHVDPMGVWRDRDISWPGGGGPRYDVIHPVTKLPCKVPERGWGFATAQVMQDQIEKGLVVFREDHTDPPFRKAYLFPIEGEILGRPEEDEFENDESETSEDALVGAQVMPSYIHKQAQVAVKALRAIFEGKKVFPNPKDHEILMRLIKYVTKSDDIILDSFAGSGPTGHAVLQLNKKGGQRRFILVEIDPQISRNVTAERMRRACHGYKKSENNKIEGLGGGFRFCKLGAACFDDHGRINPEIKFSDLARHVFFSETGEPLSKQAKANNPLIGIYRGTAIYLLYNGILKDKRPDGGNVLTQAVLDALPKHDGSRVIYGAACRFSPARLSQENIIFKQIPYEIRIH